MVDKSILRLQLAIVIGTFCESDAEIEGFLKTIAESLVKHPTIVERDNNADTSHPASQPKLCLAADTRPHHDDTLYMTEELQEDALALTGNQRLKRELESQRQEIIKLRLELARSANQTDDINLDSTFPAPKKRLQQLKGGTGRVTKKTKKAHTQENAIPLKTNPDLLVSLNGQDDMQSRFDTLSRLIELRRLISQYPSPASSKMVNDLLALRALEEAAVGTLASFCHIVDELTKNAIAAKQPTCNTPAGLINGILINLESLVTPLFLENFSLANSSDRKAQINHIWSDQIIPSLFQQIEQLFGKILLSIKRLWEHLSQHFLGQKRFLRTGLHLESSLELNEQLLQLAKGFAKKSAQWKGNIQTNLIKLLLDQLVESTSKEDKLGNSENIGYLVNILRSFCDQSSPSTFYKHNSQVIKERIEKIIMNQEDYKSRSISWTICRDLNHVLMRLWTM
ncbi:hypothetical protein O181_060518 [Austropuccinia psidii MF-1]|uniref:Uncharacterized protein n=1 Tax=Austropuccinia psidii MF-1 TaxID=1389203 RepID=A0A9Q3EGM0_9BASI|nr:hypothetical protein [Austropuccinia psidii MF-1]